LQKRGLSHYPCKVLKLLPGDQVRFEWGVTEEQAIKKSCKVEEGDLPAKDLLKWNTLASSEISKSSPHTHTTHIHTPH
jgi:hypothetical protein